MLHKQSRGDFAQMRNSWAFQCTRNSSIFFDYLKQDWHLIVKIDCTVRMFRRCNTLLSLQNRRNVQHRDRTWRVNSSFRSLRMFRIQSCILFLGMHSSSGSRTWGTTWILGLNHGWNRTFVVVSSLLRGSVPFLTSSKMNSLSIFQSMCASSLMSMAVAWVASPSCSSVTFLLSFSCMVGLDLLMLCANWLCWVVGLPEHMQWLFNVAEPASSSLFSFQICVTIFTDIMSPGDHSVPQGKWMLSKLA